MSFEDEDGNMIRIAIDRDQVQITTGRGLVFHLANEREANIIRGAIDILIAITAF